MIRLFHGYSSQEKAMLSLHGESEIVQVSISKVAMAQVSHLLEKKSFYYPTVVVGPLDQASNCDPLLKCLETYSERFRGALYAHHLGYVPRTILSRCDEVIYADKGLASKNPYQLLAQELFEGSPSRVQEILSKKKRSEMRDLFLAYMDIVAENKDYKKLAKMYSYLEQDEILPFQLFRLAI
jgi:hypothetical protein